MLRGASPSDRTLASAATPTTSQGGSPSSRRRTRRPTASPSSQKRRAIASLMMTTGCVSGRSASLKLRPRRISMPAAPKNPGSTWARSATKAPRSPGGSKPATLKSLVLVLSGFRCRRLIAPTASTPGSSRKRSSRRRV